MRGSNFDQEGDGTVVDQLDLHVGPEPAGGDRGAERAQGPGERLDQGFGHLRGRRRDSTTGAAPGACRRRG